MASFDVRGRVKRFNEIVHWVRAEWDLSGNMLRPERDRYLENLNRLMSHIVSAREHLHYLSNQRFTDNAQHAAPAADPASRIKRFVDLIDGLAVECNLVSDGKLCDARYVDYLTRAVACLNVAHEQLLSSLPHRPGDSV